MHFKGVPEEKLGLVIEERDEHDNSGVINKKNLEKALEDARKK